MISNSQYLLSLIHYILLEIQPPYGGLLSSYFGGQQPSSAPEEPFGPKGDFVGLTDRRTNRWTDNGFKGVRSLIHHTLCIIHYSLSFSHNLLSCLISDNQKKFGRPSPPLLPAQSQF